MADLHTLVFEIGTEEIPAFDLHRATEQLKTLFPRALDALAIPHGDIAVCTTPRRLIMMASDVPDTTEAREEVFRGPSAQIAFDAQGNPTKAALGFARGKGVDASGLEVRAVNGVDYVFACVRTPAREVKGLLSGALEKLIGDISWPKSCRWGSTSEYFSRPVRWLLCLLDEEVIPVRFARLESSNTTQGHRVLAPGAHKVATASDILSVLKDAFVLTSEEARAEAIRAGVAEVEADTGSFSRLPEKTLLEVTNLCEYPTVLVGTFDEEFLKVPEEIIVDAMLMHQRYFPLYDAAGKLTNRFIVVGNGNPACSSVIVDGNERVVRARLSDAKFFYEEDLKRPLESFVERLDEVVFQEALGTMRAKTDRVVSLAAHLAEDAGLSQTDAADALRAAYLAKADLVTNAVVEFTSVQGVMGGYYATASGENQQVAQAIAQHYRPRFSGDATPDTSVGKVVSMADKLDTVCGLFAVGQGPTGTSDPFALRRSSLGIISMMEAGLEVSLVGAINASLDAYAAAGLAFDRNATFAAIIDFFITRTKVLLRDRGCGQDAVDAVMACKVQEPLQIISRVEALEKARFEARDTFVDLAIAYARANNLRDASEGVDFDESLLCEVERDLSVAIEQTEKKLAASLEADDYATALQDLSQLRRPIDAFFERIMVMDEDLNLRCNRMKLLNRFTALFANVADFSKLAK